MAGRIATAATGVGARGLRQQRSDTRQHSTVVYSNGVIAQRSKETDAEKAARFSSRRERDELSRAGREEKGEMEKRRFSPVKRDFCDDLATMSDCRELHRTAGQHRCPERGLLGRSVRSLGAAAARRFGERLASGKCPSNSQAGNRSQKCRTPPLSPPRTFRQHLNWGFGTVVQLIEARGSKHRYEARTTTDGRR